MKEPKSFHILTINPGSTTTKIAVFRDEEAIYENVLRHRREELDELGSVMNQKELRERLVIEALRSAEGEDGFALDAVVGRCGMVKPLDAGTYEIGERLARDLASGEASLHASSLGGLIARDVGARLGIPAFTVDPIVVDEMNPQAKLTGIPGVERRSIFHALNAKAMAARACAEMGRAYENSRLIVAHMGGGITVGAHLYGRVVDVNDAMMGEGPFTPERSGAVPLVPVIDMCFSGRYTRQEMMDLITNGSGMQALLGTNDLKRVERMIKNGDSFAALVLESMAYQVSKQIGAMVAVLAGRVDAIVLTGGLAYSNRFTGFIKQSVDLIAPIYVFPGENEMIAMAQGALAVLRGERPLLQYEG